MHFISSLLGSLLLLCATMTNTSRASSILKDSESPEYLIRQLRSFPYSVSFYRMLGHERQLKPYYGTNDEVAALIDSMNNNIGSVLSEDVYQTRPRRSDGFRGYACRFKFCRIYDA